MHLGLNTAQFSFLFGSTRFRHFHFSVDHLQASRRYRPMPRTRVNKLN